MHTTTQIHHTHHVCTITQTPHTPHAHNHRHTTHTMCAQSHRHTTCTQSDTPHTHHVHTHACTCITPHTWQINTLHTHTWMGTLFEVRSWKGQRKTGRAVGRGRPRLGTQPGVLYRECCVAGRRLSQPPAPAAVRKGQRRWHTPHGEPAQSQPPSLSGKKGILERSHPALISGTSHQVALQSGIRPPNGWTRTCSTWACGGAAPLCPAWLGCGTGWGRLWLLLLSCSVMSDSLGPHELQHARLPCPSPSPRACSNSCPLSQWCPCCFWSVTKPCTTLWDHMDCSPPDSSVHGVLARILERVPFSRQGSNLHLLHWQAGSLPLSHLGSPVIWS